MLPWIDGFVPGPLEQQGAPWRLIARDDASSDPTQYILRTWRAPWIAITPFDEVPRNLGIIGNYDVGLAPYVLTADPDDVWLHVRIPVTLAALLAAEPEFGAGTPEIHNLFAAFGASQIHLFKTTCAGRNSVTALCTPHVP